MIVVLQAMWIFILVMPVLTEMAGTGNILAKMKLPLQNNLQEWLRQPLPVSAT